MTKAIYEIVYHRVFKRDESGDPVVTDTCRIVRPASAAGLRSAHCWAQAHAEKGEYPATIRTILTTRE